MCTFSRVANLSFVPIKETIRQERQRKKRKTRDTETKRNEPRHCLAISFLLPQTESKEEQEPSQNRTEQNRAEQITMFLLLLRTPNTPRRDSKKKKKKKPQEKNARKKKISIPSTTPKKIKGKGNRKWKRGCDMEIVQDE